MRFTGTLRQEFLKKWLMGLQICNSLNQNMTILERKRAIKLSADVAMASARAATTRWSRALIAEASKESQSRSVVQHLLGRPSERSKRSSTARRAAPPQSVGRMRRVRSKSILRRSFEAAHRMKKMMKRKTLKDASRSYAVAKRLVKKRRDVLRGLIPGGEAMEDECTLMEETVDYVLSLKAQVDVMRRLATAAHLLIPDN